MVRQRSTGLAPTCPAAPGLTVRPLGVPSPQFLTVQPGSFLPGTVDTGLFLRPQVGDPCPVSPPTETQFSLFSLMNILCCQFTVFLYICLSIHRSNIHPSIRHPTSIRHPSSIRHPTSLLPSIIHPSIHHPSFHPSSIHLSMMHLSVQQWPSSTRRPSPVSHAGTWWGEPSSSHPLPP